MKLFTSNLKKKKLKTTHGHTIGLIYRKIQLSPLDKNIVYRSVKYFVPSSWNLHFEVLSALQLGERKIHYATLLSNAEQLIYKFMTFELIKFHFCRLMNIHARELERCEKKQFSGLFFFMNVKRFF